MSHAIGWCGAVYLAGATLLVLGITVFAKQDLAAVVLARENYNRASLNRGE